MNPSLLLLSDNKHQSQSFLQALTEANFQVDILQAEHDLQAAEHYQLIIIDIHHDFDFAKNCLKELHHFPHLLIMILGHESITNCLEAFALGADDYLKKPFLHAECFARIKALNKRSHLAASTDSQLSYGPIHLNCLTRHAFFNQTPLHLTNSEFNLLELFLRYPGRVLSKEQLTEYSLGRKYTLYDRSIDVHVSNLRHKLNQSAQDENTIETVRGYGYTFVAKG